MYSRFQSALKYLHYYLTASNGKGHGIHSPFVYKFIKDVLNDSRHFKAYDIVEELRKRMLQDQGVIDVEDFGAGSAVSKTNLRSIASIAKNAAKPKKYGQLLFRIINYYKPQTILELGTSLGITTAYLASANSGAKVMTMEGSGTIANIAKENFKTLELKNTELIEGNFDQTLSSVISQLSSVDFAFIDGNHRREPTERYFKQLLPILQNDSILVFDDIHWSEEMEEAWKNIKEHPAVRCSIGLFFIGIVFLKEEFKEKQHFTIRF